MKGPSTIFTIILLTSVLVGLGQASSKNFKTKIEDFISSKQDNYSLLDKTRNESGNDYILDTKTVYTWKRAICLKGKLSFRNKYNQTVYPRIYLSFYQYKDTTECTKARLQLLNCVGGDCTSVKWGNNGSSVKSSPFIYVFNLTQIIVGHIACEHTNNDWTLFKKDLLINFKLKDSKVMELQGCGAPLIFYN